MRRASVYLAFLALCLTANGCRRGSTVAVANPPPATQPAITVPATGPATTGPTVTFGNAKLGIIIEYPSTWVVRKNDDYELFLLPPGTPDGRSISLDVPDLPFHIPGMIPMGSVQSGYVDDVKKQYGAVKVERLTPPEWPKCSVRLVRCAGQSKGHGIVDMALLVVHNDRVYILRASADAPGEPEVRAAFDAIIKSIRWVNP